MSTHIEWAEETWNPVSGCTRVSPGCDHCYIERTVPFRIAGRRFDGDDPGSTTGVQLHDDRLEQPLHWRKPRRVFVNSLADLFHEQVPEEYIARVFAVMARTPQHTYQILTKRHARMRSLLTSWAPVDGVPPWTFTGPWPLPNVWLGVSVENQQWADIRVPALLKTPAAIRFLSCEPLLGAVNLSAWLPCPAPVGGSPANRCLLDDRPIRNSLLHAIDWVIVGGESGPGARPMHPDWARSLRDQCTAASVPYFMKQAGAVLAREWGCSDQKGHNPAEWPEPFPREYPHAA